MSVPVHLVAGFLGAGKTTLLLEQLALRDGDERCAVLVNDFGEARFDADRFVGQVPVRDIPGGCICCTAPEALAPTLSALLAAEKPDRVFIEATGLARPADIIDTLARSGFGDRIELAPVIVVVDPERLLPKAPALLMDQIDAAAVLIANRVDLASAEGLAAFDAVVDAHYPPLIGTWKVSRGQAPREVFELRRTSPAQIWRPVVQSVTPSTQGWEVVSRGWEPAFVHDMGQLKTALSNTGVARVKGVFHTDIGWYRLELTHGELEAVPSPQRTGGRVDAIGKTGSGVQALVDALDAARYVPPAADQVPVVRLVDPGGYTVELSQPALAALPGQVHDVAAVIPGRPGHGVWLHEVLSLAAPPPGATFILVAHDGMTTEPTPVAQAGEAVLVHGLDDHGLPENKGGPFRILVPPGEGRSACANVKKLARVLIAAP
jgi:G3E family GTPase